MNRPLNPLGIYYAYLRKSRADRDAEAHGEGETLLRHEYWKTWLPDSALLFLNFTGKLFQEKPSRTDLLSRNCCRISAMENVTVFWWWK